MRTGTVMSSEIAEAGGVLNAAYYLGRKDGETYEQWTERSQLEGWVNVRIFRLEHLLKRRTRGRMSALVKLRRELMRRELAYLREKYRKD